MSGNQRGGRTESESSSKIVYAEHMLQAMVLKHAPWYNAKDVKTIFYRNLARDRLQQPRLVDRLKQREQTGGRPLGAVDTMLGLEDQVPEVTHNTIHAPLLPRPRDNEPSKDNTIPSARKPSVDSRSSQGSLFALDDQLATNSSNNNNARDHGHWRRHGASARGSLDQTPQPRLGPSSGQTAPVGQPRPTLPSPPYKDLEARSKKPQPPALLPATASQESLKICIV